MSRLIWVMTLTFGCAGNYGVKGEVVDGLSGDAIGGGKVVARATGEDASMACQVFEAVVSEAGAFELEGLCGGTGYRLELSDETLFAAEDDTVPAGGPGGPFVLRVWRTPGGSSVSELSGSTLTAFKTLTAIKKQTVGESEDKKGVVVRYPAEVPEVVARIEPGEHLILSGADTIAQMKFVPLIVRPAPEEVHHVP